MVHDLARIAREDNVDDREGHHAFTCNRQGGEPSRPSSINVDSSPSSSDDTVGDHYEFNVGDLDLNQHGLYHIRGAYGRGNAS